jgi:hypothetical protein
MKCGDLIGVVDGTYFNDRHMAYVLCGRLTVKPKRAAFRYVGRRLRALSKK